MEPVKVNKDELLERLETNRAGHRVRFEQAWAGYRRRVEEELERKLADVRAGREIETYISLTPPRDHTDDYDTVIQMVRWEVGAEIVLSARDFAAYVLDKWQWQKDFTAETAYYVAEG